MDDLDRLPNLSPIDEPEISPMPGRAHGPTRMTMAIVLIVIGAVVIVICGSLLFAVTVNASKAAGDDPEASSRVLGWMFGNEHGATVAIVASIDILMGIAFIALGIVKVVVRRRKPDA
jgi:hypothetical protein